MPNTKTFEAWHEIKSMVTSVGLLRTLRTTKDPYTAMLLKFCNSRKIVTFRNGSKLRLTWPQFRYLRDNYLAIQRYPIKQVGEELFMARFASFDLVADLPMICCVANLSQKYNIERVEDDLFHIKNRKFDLVGTSSLLNTVWELERGEYDCDCRNKVVLDVGGFQGETAAFFAYCGATKVILYEPVKAHHSLIKRNVLANNVNAEIHACGIGSKDGVQVINYDRTDVTFGMISKGRFKMKIKIKNAVDVIAESQADVAKFDCEGAEESLINVPSETLRRISFYMLELHGSRTIKSVATKFRSAGFSIARVRNGSSERANISFRRQ